jgi:hypothetical protein
MTADRLLDRAERLFHNENNAHGVADCLHTRAIELLKAAKVRRALRGLYDAKIILESRRKLRD